MTQRTAALISTIGHPFVLLPLAFCFLALQRANIGQAWPTLVAILACLATMGAFVYVKKRRGKISNWDISNQKERSRNVYQPVLALVLITAAVLHFTGQSFVGETLYFGLLMATCYAINSRIKVSQHTVMATYLGMLVLEAHPWAGVSLLIFAGLIAWSRVVLGRHQINEVLLGAGVGVLFGGLHAWIFG